MMCAFQHNNCITICTTYSELFFWEIVFIITVILINKRGIKNSAWPWGQSARDQFISILLRSTFFEVVSFSKERVGAVQEKANELTINQCRQTELIAGVHILSFISLGETNPLSFTLDGCTSILKQNCIGATSTSSICICICIPDQGQTIPAISPYLSLH